MTRRLAALAAAAAVFVVVTSPVPSGQGQAPQAAAPKLAVLLVVDQMRADYVDRFRADWTGGLKRIVDQGAWFPRAAMPYMTTMTCAGHATIGTGAFPNHHGIVQNDWWNRAEQRARSCTDDAGARNIGYLRPAGGNDGGGSLMVPTFADEMRRQRGARVVVVSRKPDVAIMLAGHGGDAVMWLSGGLDDWNTSTAFTSAPVPAVRAVVQANNAGAYFRRVWDRLLPAAKYLEADNGLGETPLPGMTALFPHALNGASSTPDGLFRAQWEQSPFLDEYIGQVAGALAESMQLGRHNTTDVLAIGFSATDIIGHYFGPRSQEIHDTIDRLDRTIGVLLDRLDRVVGRDQYVVGLTSDHGIQPIPEQLIQEGRSGGRLSAAMVVDRVETRLQSTLGRGRHVAGLSGTNMNLYFLPGVYDRLKAAPAAMNGVIDAIQRVDGVARVLRSDEVQNAQSSTDPAIRAAALSYYADRSGDLMIVLKPGWIMYAIPAMHGTASPDDQQVPLMLMGPGIKPGVYTQAATPADVVPTLASLSGVTLQRADGRVLREAVR